MARWKAAARTPRHAALLAIILGILAGAGHVPVSMPLVTIAAFLGLFALNDRAPNAVTSGLIGWAAGLGYFGATMFWVVEPFFVDAARHGWMAPFALIGLSAGLAFFWFLAFFLSFRLLGSARRRLVAVVLLVVLFELARGYILTGFPWGLVGYVWSETSVFQWLAWIGPYGLSAATLGVAALPLLVRPAAVAGPIVFGAAALGVVFGAARVDEQYTPREDVVFLRIVQPDARQDLKWRPDKVGEFFDRQIDLTNRDGAQKPDLVIWPETAVAFLLGRDASFLADMATAGQGAPIVFGARRLQGSRLFNSLAAVNVDAAVVAVYDKHRLVPFGEYIPFGASLGQYLGHGLASQLFQGFSQGQGADIISLDGIPPFLPLICYEAIFPHMAHGLDDRPEWILQITNDAWFGDFSGPFQHFAQARARAIEQGLPLVRSANTGVSAIIDAYGGVVASLPMGVDGALDGALPAAIKRPLYARTGDLPLTIAVLLALLAMGVFERHKNNRLRFND